MHGNQNFYVSISQASSLLKKSASISRPASTLSDPTTKQTGILNFTHQHPQGKQLRKSTQEDTISISILLGICGLAALIPIVFTIWSFLVRYFQLLDFYIFDESFFGREVNGLPQECNMQMIYRALG